MTFPTLDSLLLTEEELVLARKQVEELAYFRWLDAGRPSGRDMEFWRDAELYWIEYLYVPDRYHHY